MKYKTEIFLLLLAIVLYIVSTFSYSYEERADLPYIGYPYRYLALPLAVVATMFLAVAAISYSKRR